MAIYSNESRFLSKDDLLKKLINKNVITSDENDLFLLGGMIDYISYSTLGKGLKSTGLVDDNGKFQSKYNRKWIITISQYKYGYILTTL